LKKVSINNFAGLMGDYADKNEKFFLKEKGFYFIKEEYKYITNSMQPSSTTWKNRADGETKEFAFRCWSGK